MAPASILDELWAQGITVTLVDDGNLQVSPRGSLRPGQRNLLLANKTAIVALLRESEDAASRLMADLLEAAMRVCDRHDDSPAARIQMADDCRATPPHLRSDLLDHFRSAQP